MNSVEMVSKAEAIKWWTSGEVSFQDKCELTIKHFGTDKMIDGGVHNLTDDEIEKIFFKEKIVSDPVKYDFGKYDSLSSMMNDLTRSLMSQKENIIFEALKRATGREWSKDDVIKDSENIFPRIKVIINPDSEEIYYYRMDSGEAAKIVTFLKPVYNSNQFKVEVSAKYHF